MGKLQPGESLIYERANGVVYARYANRPEVDRWIVGGDPGAVARAQGKLIDYGEWNHLSDLAETYPSLKIQMDKLIKTYYLIKDTKS